MDKPKSIFESKTFWFNIVSTAAVVSGALPPSKAVLAIATLANIGLRMLTTRPILEVTKEQE